MWLEAYGLLTLAIACSVVAVSCSLFALHRSTPERVQTHNDEVAAEVRAESRQPRERLTSLSEECAAAINAHGKRALAVEAQVEGRIGVIEAKALTFDTKQREFMEAIEGLYDSIERKRKSIAASASKLGQGGFEAVAEIPQPSAIDSPPEGATRQERIAWARRKLAAGGRI